MSVEKTKFEVVVSKSTDLLEYLFKMQIVDESVEWLEKVDLAEIKNKVVIGELSLEQAIVCKAVAFVNNDKHGGYSISSTLTVKEYVPEFTSKFSKALKRLGLSNQEVCVLTGKTPPAISLACSRGVRRKKSAAFYSEKLEIPIDDILE